MLNKKIINFSIILIPFIAFSQVNNEVIKKFNLKSTDSIRIDSLIELSNDYLLVNPDSSIVLFKEAAKIEKIDFPNLLFNCSIQSGIGNAFSIKEELDSAYYYSYKALQLAKKNNLKSKEAGYLINLGIINSKKGNFEKALKQYQQAKQFFEKEHKMEEVSFIINNMALLFENQELYSDAINYHKKTLLLDREINQQAVPFSYVNLSRLYLITSKLDSAKYYVSLSKKTFTNQNDKYGLAIVEGIQGNIFEKENNIDQAKQKYLNTIKMFKEIDNNLTLEPLVNMANVIAKNNRINAEEYFLEAEKIAVKINNKFILDDIYLGMGNFYNKIKEYEKSANYLLKRIDIHDEIVSVKKDKVIKKLITKYKLKEKQQKIDLLHRENEVKKQKLKTRNFIILILFLLIIIILAFTFLLKQKKEQEIINKEIQLQKYLFLMNDNKNKVDINSKAFANKYSLTNREIEILNLLRKGISYSSIGEKLFISKNTVKYHLKNIYLKLDVKNKIEALNKISS